MRQLLKTSLEHLFQLTHDLVVHLEETALNLDLTKLPSNRIAGQLWCMVGAREEGIAKGRKTLRNQTRQAQPIFKLIDSSRTPSS